MDKEPPSHHPEPAFRFLAGDGAASRYILSMDWTRTPLGPWRDWPPTLKIALGIVLRTPRPTLLWWGQDLVQFANDAFLADVQREPQAATEHRATQFWAAAWPALQPGVDQAMRSGQACTVDSCSMLVSDAGDCVQRRLELTPVVDAQGISAGLIVAVMDSTGSAALEHTQHLLREAMDSQTRLAKQSAAFEQAAQFMRKVTDSIPGRVAYWDAQTRCLFANRGFAQWFGMAPEDMVGRTPMEMFGPNALDGVRPYLDGALAGHPQIFETHARQPDGSVLSNQVHYLPDALVNGVPPGIFVMGFDITALKQAEAALKTANDDLALARDAAQAGSRAKGAFLANISHEIRTPLNAILGMTHLLSRRISDAGQLQQLAKVENAANHLLNLISDVLDLSKIEAGKLDLEHNDFAPTAIIDSALEMVRASAQAKGLQLLHETSGLPATVCGDALRLSQILINLLSNAVKFTARGSVTLRGATLEAMDGRYRLRFEVEDTGIGIAASDQSHLFGAFAQADSSIRRSHGGTGLGLALSRQLARAMGGEAGVESCLGVGSTFWFDAWLDAGRASTDTQAPAHGTPEQRHATLPALEARMRALHAERRILLAEDNPVNQEVAVSLLECVGLWVTTANDGEEAIARVESEHFDLVLMDMQMPRVDGLEAARAIRAGQHGLPIIAMTANAFAEDRQACMDAGMNDHLAKPFQPEAMYALLLKWLPPRDPASSPLAGLPR